MSKRLARADAVTELAVPVKTEPEPEESSPSPQRGPGEVIADDGDDSPPPAPAPPGPDASRRDKERPVRLSPIMSDIRNEEETSLKEWLDKIGPQGAFKVQLRRVKPTHVRVNGRDVPTQGFLDTYDHTIDEEFIQREHGGGTYSLKITRRGNDGSFKYVQGMHRTIDIAGEPNLERLPSNAPATAASAPPPPQESIGLVKEAFGVMRDQIDSLQKREPAPAKGIDPALQLMLEQMRRDAERRDAELADLRKDLATARTAKPPEDPIKEKLLGSLLDGQSGHVEALRLRHEAELRQIKENMREDEKRMADRYERDMTAMRASHERDMAVMRSGYEREITSIRAAHDTAISAVKTSLELQIKLLEADIRRLERDNGEQRSEVKELRAKKDKGIVEIAKELESVREAIGGPEGDKSSFDKVVEVLANPAAGEFVRGIFGKGEPAAAAAAGAAPAAPVQPSRQIVQAPDGQRFLRITDAQGTRMVPAKKKPKVIPATVNPDGTVATPAIELPDIDPEAIATVVNYLERAFAGRQEPEVVAQSARPMVPDEILSWIRTNDTAEVSGVDLFMAKVAKLPNASPLASQSGKNWLRRVGKALTS